MFDVSLANLFRLVVGLEIVLAFRQAQSALPDLHNYFGAVFCILGGAHEKERIHIAGMKVSDLFLKVALIFDLVYPRHFGGEGRNPVGFDLFLVHATGVKVSHLLFAATLRGASILRSRLENRPKHVAILFRQDAVHAPGWESSWNRVLREPAAGSVLIEISAGLRVHIEIGQIKTGGGLTEDGCDRQR